MSATPTSGPASNRHQGTQHEFEERADAAAWLAVAAGSIGAMMATLDISIVNSILPTIQGEIGATGAEGTWVATAYMVAEIIIIPLTSWLERLLGLRTLLICAAVLFTSFSIVCGIAEDLTTMIIGRAGQGFSGGAMIPTAMSIVATRLPRRQQPVGSALFGLTAILGPVVGPLLGGWLAETFSWHSAFFINIPVGLALLVLLFLGLPHRKTNFDQLFHADWLGILGMTMCLGGLTLVLEEGQREQWFESPLIISMAVGSLFGLLLLLAGQIVSRRPVVRLSLLADRQFGSVVAMGFVLGMVVFGSAFAIPQFLSSVAGYNALDSGKIVALSGVPSLLLMPFVPLLIRSIDVRLAVLTGMIVLAVSCASNTHLTSSTGGDDFFVAQLMRGFGTIFSFLFLNQAAIAAVSAEMAGDAAGLFNASRNIGGSFVVAAIAAIQDQRLALHSRQLEASLATHSEVSQDYLQALGDAAGDPGSALRLLANTISQQAIVMTFSDMFLLLAIGIGCAIPLVLFLRPLPKGANAAPLH